MQPPGSIAARAAVLSSQHHVSHPNMDRLDRLSCVHAAMFSYTPGGRRSNKKRKAGALKLTLNWAKERLRKCRFHTRTKERYGKAVEHAPLLLNVSGAPWQLTLAADPHGQPCPPDGYWYHPPLWATSITIEPPTFHNLRVQQTGLVLACCMRSSPLRHRGTRLSSLWRP